MGGVLEGGSQDQDVVVALDKGLCVVVMSLHCWAVC